MDKNPQQFYSEQLDFFHEALQKVKRRLFAVGMLRLGLFSLTVWGVVALRAEINVAISIGAAGLVIFLIMVSKNTDLKLEKKRLEALLELNLRELRILDRDYSGLPLGEKWVGERHYYNQDIDLFGQGSIFHLINRTATADGEAKLAAILNANDVSDILAKQTMIRELAGLPLWRQNFQTTAGLVESEIDNHLIVSWMANYKTSIPKLMGFLPWLFMTLTVVSFALFGLGFIAGSVLAILVVIGLLVTFPFFGRISKLYLAVSQMTATFSQYAKLLTIIENQSFQSTILKAEQDKIKAHAQKASAIFNTLAKLLNNMDQRNNILFAVVANGFLLWDLKYAYRIEKWIVANREVTAKWFEAIAHIDAFNSLGNYAFNYPDHIFPKLTEDASVFIKALALGHPLLKVEQRVSNDLEIAQTDFMIITGANMAGKSTFLRTVALNLVMANTGLPVCAAYFEYKPLKLITSMRTSDSLINDESYFFSELKRLKFIVDELKKDHYFIILDEILKGTNSKDKEEGSKKFVQKLVHTGSTGIIATHDLSLCELAHDLPQIKNRYFDAEIVNDELYFDYRFKDGICKNMNASFLLRKMEIVD